MSSRLCAQTVTLRGLFVVLMATTCYVTSSTIAINDHSYEEPNGLMRSNGAGYLIITHSLIVMRSEHPPPRSSEDDESIIILVE